MLQNVPLPDHSSHRQFVEYYAEKSLRPELVEHLCTIRNKIVAILDRKEGPNRKYDMVDVGCNAGTQ